MFTSSLNGLPESFCKDWNDRYIEFTDYETVLPSWKIRFHSFIPDENCLHNYKLGDAGKYSFYEIGQSYFIFIHAYGQSFAVMMPKDYTTVDVYYSDSPTTDRSISLIQALLCQSYRYRALTNDGLIIHSSSIQHRNEGILFFGHSGAGKSTQAELWKNTVGAKILNYDQNYVFKQKNRFMISSTPWGGKEKHYVNNISRLRALVFVQKSLNRNQIKKVDISTGFSALYLHNYVFPINKIIEERFWDILSDLVTNVPVYILYCTKSEEAVFLLHRQLFGDYV